MLDSIPIVDVLEADYTLYRTKLEIYFLWTRIVKCRVWMRKRAKFVDVRVQWQIGEKEEKCRSLRSATHAKPYKAKGGKREHGCAIDALERWS